MAAGSIRPWGAVMNKRKSRKPISEKTKIKLWMRAGGRCQYEGCNAPLWQDDVTMTKMNKAYLAHIVADSPRGKRGHKVLSRKLATDFNNLMLLCDTHHRLIDVEAPEAHSVDRLAQMKEIHEQRIEAQTSVHFDRKTEILLYGANIGAQAAPLSYSKAALAISPHRYPVSPAGISLSMKNSSFRETDDTFWALEKENLQRLFDQRVRPLVIDGTIKHLSVFGLAPQPLLVLLGSLITDINEADVFQLHREPSGWNWPDIKATKAFTVEEPTAFNKPPALVLSLSADIADQRISDALGEGNYSLWKVTTQAPHIDFLKSPEQLRHFRSLMRTLLNKIKMKHGEGHHIHLFPAAPVAVCVELGRVRMPKADLPFRIYDQLWKGQKTGFFPALDL
ncbi:MAG: SAVED domain-containing protein [Bdellovibrionaceae bacterium]|nr:SAVED domain-containing protein [Pseudobdellovibrionaceae bacterium]